MMTEEKSQDVAQPDPSQTIVGGGGVCVRAGDCHRANRQHRGHRA